MKMFSCVRMATLAAAMLFAAALLSKIDPAEVKFTALPVAVRLPTLISPLVVVVAPISPLPPAVMVLDTLQRLDLVAQSARADQPERAPGDRRHATEHVHRHSSAAFAVRKLA